MANQNLSVGNVVAFIGRAAGGEPNKALRFGSPAEAQATLRDGELLTAVLKAFDPSAQVGGPATVVAIRANPAEPARLTLLASNNNPVNTPQTTDYSLTTTPTTATVESGRKPKSVRKGKRGA